MAVVSEKLTTSPPMIASDLRRRDLEVDSPSPIGGAQVAKTTGNTGSTHGEIPAMRPARNAMTRRPSTCASRVSSNLHPNGGDAKVSPSKTGAPGVEKNVRSSRLPSGATRRVVSGFRDCASSEPRSFEVPLNCSKPLGHISWPQLDRQRLTRRREQRS